MQGNSNFNSNFLSRKTHSHSDLHTLIENINQMNPNSHSNLAFNPSLFMSGSQMHNNLADLNSIEYKTAFKNLIKQKLENEALSKSIYLKIDNINNMNIYIHGINQISEPSFLIKMMIGDKILFMFKNDNRLIKHLFANNFFIAVYDNKSILTCYTLFNSLVSYSLILRF